MSAIIDFNLTFTPEEKQSPLFPKRFSDQTRKNTFVTKDSSMSMDISDSKILSSHLYNFEINNIKFWCIGIFIYKSINPKKSLKAFAEDYINNKVQYNELNGQFLLYSFNHETHNWDFWTDRFGTVHSYYSCKLNNNCIGSYYPAVSQLSKAINLNHTAISSFFKMGFFPCDLTWHTDICIMEPASHYSFNKIGKLIGDKKYWNWSFNPNLNRSYQSTVREFHDLFNQVIEEGIHGKNIAIPISGGLDSRSTIAALNSEKINLDLISLFSYGYTEDSIETTIAKRIAKGIQYPIKTFSIEPYLFEKLDKVSGATECFQDLTQTRQAFLENKLNPTTNYLLAAHWGDVWLDDSGLNQNQLTYNELFDFEMKKFTKRGGNWLFDNYIPIDNVDKTNQLVMEKFKNSFQKYKSIGNNDFILKAFKTDHWSFRWTLSSIRMYQLSFYPILPFYDTRLTDFFATVPSSFLKDRRLQIDYIKLANPKLAKIMWERYNYNLYKYKYRKNLLIPDRIVKKTLRTLFGKKKIQRNWEIQFNKQKGIQNLKSLFFDSGELFDFFPKAKIENLVNSHINNKTNPESGYALSMLLTFSSWIHQITGKPLTSDLV